jgi:hypothetical protein
METPIDTQQPTSVPTPPFSSLRVSEVNLPFIKVKTGQSERKEVVTEQELKHFKPIDEDKLALLQTENAHTLDANLGTTAFVLKTMIPIPPNTKLYNDSEVTSKYSVEIGKSDVDSLALFTNKVQQEIKFKTEELEDQDREQWVARAMKRNTDLLCLMERLRPLSKHQSFSHYIAKKYKRFSPSESASNRRLAAINSTRMSVSNHHHAEEEANNTAAKGATSTLDLTEIVSTTENQRVLSRESLIQLIHQHLAHKKYYKTIQVLGKETGVKYNGYLAPSDDTPATVEESDISKEKAVVNGDQASPSDDDKKEQHEEDVVVEEEDEQVLKIQREEKQQLNNLDEEDEPESTVEKNWSIIRTLFQIAIKDPARPLTDVLTSGSGVLRDLDVDAEVQTASIYNHMEEEYVHELKKGLWDELSDPNENNVEYMDDKDKEKMQKKLTDDEELEGKQFKAATLNKLVEKLTDYGAQDGKFLNTFLVTYRSFTVPEVLLIKLLERYQVPKRPAYPNISDEQWEKIKVQIQIRTGNVLNKWIDEFFSLDWNQQMIRLLTIFIEDFLLKNKGTARMGKTMRTKLNRKLQQAQGKQDIYAVQFSEAPKIPEVPKNIFLKLEMFDVSDLELARQLTRQEHDIYRRIEPSELLNQAWSKEKLRHRSPHVLQSTQRFNNISNWVACQIVAPESLKVRIARWTKFINIAKHIYKLNNFNTLLAIISGMQNAGVHRLKFTKDGLDRRTVEDYDFLMAKMSSDRSYRAYREHILSCSPPCTPYLGIYLTDLTFVEDGNPDFLKSKRTGRDLINWTKRRFVHNVISEIQTYQYKPYNIQIVHQIDRLLAKTLDNHVYMDDDPLYKLSLKREPRNAKKEELVA